MAADSVGQIGLDLTINQNQFQKQMSGIQGLAKKAGVALAAAFAVKKIWDFGAACIQLGSDLSEVQNVVDVTFPQMSKQVDTFAKNAAFQFGLSETMAKKYTGTFGAMAKAFGFPEQAAYEMSTALTGLSGDVASFYNISQDEAYTKLKSVFTGETESLKDLGVVMTQSALDQYALANGYGKTTQAMSEAEKVGLRYKFVTDQLSIASGDFIRTSEGWANQVRILKLQFDSLKATIGQGLINVLTPVIKVINLIINKLMSLANAFKAFTEMVTGKKGSGDGATAAAAGMEAVAGSADQAGAAMGGAGGAAKKAAKDMKSVTTGIDELNIIDSDTDSGDGGGGGGAGGGYAGDQFDMGTLPEDTEEASALFDNLLAKAKGLAELFKQGLFEGLGDTSVFDSIQNSIQGIGESLKNIFTAPEVLAAGYGFVNDLTYNLGRVAGSIGSIGATIAANLLGGINKYLQQNTGRIKDYIVSMFKIGSRAAEIQGDVAQTWALVISAFRSEEAQQITADIIGIFANAFMGVTELTAQFSVDTFDMLTAPFVENGDLIKTTLEDTFSAVQPIFSNIKALVDELFTKVKTTYDEHVAPMIAAFRDGFTEIAAKILELYNKYFLPVLTNLSTQFAAFKVQYLSPLIDKFLEFGGNVADAITLLWTNVLQPFVLWFMDTAVPYVTAFVQSAINSFFLLMSGISTVVSDILAFLNSLIEFIVGVFTGDWEKAWGAIESYFDQKWETMKNLVSLAIQAIRNTISTVMNVIKAFWEQIWNTIGIFAGDKWNDIKSNAEELFGAIRDKLAEIWDEVKKTIEEKWNAIKDWFTEIWTKIKEVFKIDEMLEVGKNIMNKLWEGMKGVWDEIAGWLGNIADLIGSTFNSIINRAKDLITSAKEEAEDNDVDEDNDGGPRGYATGGFPEDGWFRASHGELMGKFDNGQSVVANNQQITQGIAQAVRSGIGSSIASAMSGMASMMAAATPNLAMAGNSAPVYNPGEEHIQGMVDRAVSMADGGLKEGHLETMVELLRKIVELIETMDLTVSIDLREVKKKLIDLDKRTGYTLRTT